MSRVVALAALLVASTVSSLANAQPKQPKLWSVEAGAGLVVLGTGEGRTGGVAPTIGARYALPLGESAVARFGLDAGVFGLGGDPHWIGFFVGPAAGAVVKPTKSIGLGAELGLDYGRAPVCNGWGICLRYWGIYPRAAIVTSYDVDEAFAVVASLHARYVDTLGWTGFGGEGRLAGRVNF